MQVLLIVAIVLYSLLMALQARRAFATADPRARQREAVRLLLLTSFGLVLVAVLILAVV